MPLFLEQKKKLLLVKGITYFPDYIVRPNAEPYNVPGNPYKLCIHLVGQEGREEAGGHGEQEEEQPELRVAERE